MIKVLGWRSELELGVDMMDRHHREMVGLCSALDQANARGRIGEALDFLTDLVGYVGMHCEAEEELMRRSSYPGRMDHQDRHHEMGMVLKSWEYRARQRTLPLNAIFVNRLGDWVESHILGSDKGFSRFLLDQEGEDPTALPIRRKSSGLKSRRCLGGKTTVPFQPISSDRFTQTQPGRRHFNRPVAGLIHF